MNPRTIKRRQIIFLAAAITCLLAAIGFYFMRSDSSQSRNWDVKYAIKRLLKQDSRFDEAKRSLWAILPISLAHRIPNFAPPPAVTFRREAARDLIKLRPQTDEAILALIRALKDPDAEVRYSATEALGEIGPPAKAAVPALIGQLEVGLPHQMSHPIYALTRIAPESPVVLSALLNALKSPAPISSEDMLPKSAADVGRIRAVIYGLGLMGVKNPKVVPPLVNLLKDPDSSHRAAAAKALGMAGASAKDAVPLLIDLMTSQDLGMPPMRPTPSTPPAPPAPPFMINYGFEFGPDFVMAGPLKYEAAIALWKITHESKLALAVLIEGLKSKPANTRLSIVRILQKLGRQARDAVPVIAEMPEHDESVAVRELAVKFLAAFADEVPEAKASLKRALMNDKFVVRSAATNALNESYGSPRLLNRKQQAQQKLF